jgi:hypothetical protein
MLYKKFETNFTIFLKKKTDEDGTKERNKEINKKGGESVQHI